MFRNWMNDMYWQLLGYQDLGMTWFIAVYVVAGLLVWGVFAFR